jgi:hypothetical protein
MNYIIAWSNLAVVIPIISVFKTNKITTDDKDILIPLLWIQGAVSFLQHVFEMDSCNHDMVGLMDSFDGFIPTFNNIIERPKYKQSIQTYIYSMEYLFLYCDRITAWTLGATFIYLLTNNGIYIIRIDKKLFLLLVSLILIATTDTCKMTQISYTIVHSLWHLSIYTYLGWILN